MHEYKQRQEAVRRHQAKEKITNIAKALGKGRKWVYLWVNRYEADRDNPDWYKDRPKSPKHKPTKISSEQENQVIAIRESLEGQQYAQTGAISIQYEFERKGLPIPAMWTINRAISRHGLAKRPLAARPTKAYPELICSHPSNGSGGAKVYQGRWLLLQHEPDRCHYTFLLCESHTSYIL